MSVPPAGGTVLDGSGTYSRYLAQLAGSDMAMKQQLVRMVHMMNKLNKVSRLRRNNLTQTNRKTKTDSFLWRPR